MSGRQLRFGLALAVAVMPACGSSSSPTPVPSATPTPVPPTAQTIISSGSGSLPARVLAPIQFTTTALGRIDVTVDWTFATNDIDIYLARGACSFDQFVAGQCNLAVFSESTTAKPERLSLPGAAAGSYVLLVGNVGPDDESAAFQIVLTTGAGASSATAVSRPVRARGYERSIDLDRR